jgi:two-component system, OmpR family, response regulator ChvI
MNIPTNKRSMILVVDDEPDITSTLKISLEDNGFTVHTFNNPILALEKFRKRLYDLLILDIKMPQMNGFQLYTKIKTIDNKVKVCFLTALSDLHDYEQFRKEVSPKVGERHFIQKPIKNQDIVIRVKEILITRKELFE